MNVDNQLKEMLHQAEMYDVEIQIKVAMRNTYLKHRIPLQTTLDTVRESKKLCDYHMSLTDSSYLHWLYKQESIYIAYKKAVVAVKAIDKLLAACTKDIMDYDTKITNKMTDWSDNESYRVTNMPEWSDDRKN